MNEKEKDRVRRRKWRLANPDKYAAQLARQANWRADNTERIKRNSVVYYQGNYEKITAVNKQRRNSEKHAGDLVKKAEWREKNPEKVAESTIASFHKRRARLKGTQSSGVSPKQWNEICTVFGHRCAYCLRKVKPLHREHLIPIASGGGDVYENVVPACSRCNFSKGSKSLLNWISYQGSSFGQTPIRRVSLAGSTV